jgi:hypothetical protein
LIDIDQCNLLSYRKGTGPCVAVALCNKKRSYGSKKNNSNYCIIK